MAQSGHHQRTRRCRVPTQSGHSRRSFGRVLWCPCETRATHKQTGAIARNQ